MYRNETLLPYLGQVADTRPAYTDDSARVLHPWLSRGKKTASLQSLDQSLTLPLDAPPPSQRWKWEVGGQEVSWRPQSKRPFMAIKPSREHVLLFFYNDIAK